MSRRSLIVGGAAAGLIAAAVSGAAAFQVIVVLLLLVVSLAILSRLLRRFRRASEADAGHYVPFLAGSWLVLMVMPAHSFVHRRGDAVTSEIGIQPLIELGYFTAVGALALIVVRRLQHDLDSARPPAALLVLPIWVAATGVWGGPGLYSIVRAFQYSAFWALAWATMSIAAHRPEWVDEVLSSVVRWFIRVAFGLVLVGAALGPIRVPTGVENADRFTWIAAHPNASGLIMATATVLVASAPRRVTRLAPMPRLLIAAVFVVALYQNHSRTSWLCLVIGLAFVYLTAGHRRPRVWAIGGPFLALGVAIVSIFRWDAIWDYALRDGDSENLANGNGRRELWTIGLNALDTSFDWMFGLGYGVTRTLFVEEASWAASSAHNSLLAMLVGTGLIGAVILLGTVGSVVWSIVRSRVTFEYDLGRALSAAVLLMILNAAASDVLAEPTLGIGLLYLGATTARTWPRGATDPTSRVDLEASEPVGVSDPRISGPATDVGGGIAPFPEGATNSGARRTADR